MRRRYHLHIPGLVYCGLILLVGLVAIRGQNNVLFLVFGIMFAALVISGLVSGAMMMGLRVRRLDPAPTAAGEPLLIRYEVRNINRLVPVFNVHVEERPVSETNGWQRFMDRPRAWIMHVGAKEVVHGEAIVKAKQRGIVAMNHVRVWTTFPFGIIKKSITFTLPTHVLIEPRREPLKRELLRSIEIPQPVGMRISPRAGGGDDYFGLREYRSNDSIRQIAWRRSAGLDQLVSIERSQPSSPRLRVVLDLEKPAEALRIGKADGVTGRELQENAIALAASLLAMADQAGFETGLTVRGFGLPPIALRRGQRHFRRMMAALGRIDLEQSRRKDASHRALREAERTSIVVIHPDRSDDLSERSDVVYLTGRQLEQLRLPAGEERSSSKEVSTGRPKVAA